MLVPILLALTAGDATAYARPKMLVEPAELAKMIAEGKVVVLDARPRKDFLAGHAPRARWLDIAQWNKAVLADEGVEKWTRLIGFFGIDDKLPVVVYDDDRSREASRVWWMLRHWGVEDVRVLNGGWKAWAKSGEVVKEELKVPQTSPKLKRSDDRHATRDQMLKSLKLHQIVDARSKDEHCGDKAMAKRGGAMPGAKHLEWSDTLDPKTGRFKSAPELKKLMGDAGIDLDKPTSTYCQSGGRAAVMAFVFELMSGKPARNYYRSWAEWGNDAETPITKPKPKAGDGLLSAADLAVRIDEQIDARLRRAGLAAAPPAEDGPFLRRAYLDLIGRVPDLVAVRDFLDDPTADKRPQLVEQLLKHPRHPLHWANVWRDWVLADVMEGERSGPAVATWFRTELRRGASYDEMVRGLLLPGRNNQSPFLEAHLYKAESLASASSRLFLGVKLECAQCHNHPFAKWSKVQFWEAAAFFGGLPERQRFLGDERAPAKVSVGHIQIPETERIVRARLLDGGEARWDAEPREALVGWMLAKDNPYLGPAVVNRYWEYLFGHGIIDPVDEEGDDNPASHPELLALVARQFVLHEYDLKYLLRTILLTRAYQRAASPSADPRLFAGRVPRGMSAEQLYDSVATAAGRVEWLDDIPLVGSTAEDGRRRDFLLRFPARGRRTERETSSLQALHLMNGKLMSEATSLSTNRDLAVLGDGRTPAARRAEQLFLIALSRKPSAAESARFAKHLEQGGPSKRPAEAARDALWVLLNCAEFQVNP